MKKIHLRRTHFVMFLGRIGAFLLKSHVFTVWVGLGVIGFWVGTQARPDHGTVPFEELFENLRVLSYREAPTDSTVRFVVELSARGRAFRQYDVDARRFIAPAQSHDYWRSISGTRYPALKVRGHVSRGFWLELPTSASNSLLPAQFDELYSTTLDFVKPVSLVTTVVGILSGYSVGYRLATWGSSLSNPKVQDRVLGLPGIGRLVAREAWRRVALEPAVVFAESDAGRFASVSGRQRLYTNFFKLAVNDSNGFIPYEVARLEAAGSVRESHAMRAFARAVQCAGQDTCDLTSADFSAVEEWASLLDRKGHWASSAVPPPGEERLRYFGTLSWYGLAPEAPDERRIWVGPRLLVRNGDSDGFVADEIPLIRVACPVAWREWLAGDEMNLSAHAWTAQWMGDARQFAPLVNVCMGVARFVAGKHAPKHGAGDGDGDDEEDAMPEAPRVVTAGTPVAPGRHVAVDSLQTPALPADSARVASGAHSLAPESRRADSLETIPYVPDGDVFRSSFGRLGP